MKTTPNAFITAPAIISFFHVKSNFCKDILTQGFLTNKSQEYQSFLGAPKLGYSKDFKLEKNRIISMPEKNTKQFRVATIKQLTITSIFLLVQIIVFFVSAGNIANQRPWLYFIAAFVHYSVSTAAQYKLNPQLLVQRLKVKREGTKLWDEILMRTSNLMIIIAIPAVAGLDVGRFQWSNIDIYFASLGLVCITISSIALNYAMFVNIHFEPTVRIQKERAHKVITSGPYRIMRYPGYLAGILFAVSIP